LALGVIEINKIKKYLTIIAEGIASLRKLGIPCKASFDKPVQVFLQEGDILT
jgi:hypothetical protein